MAGKFKLVVKNGDYRYNQETGAYGAYDYVVRTEDPVEALHQFLDYIQDVENEAGHKVTLTFSVPKKEKKA